MCTSALNAATSESVTAYLSYDHRRLDALLDEVAAAVEDGDFELAEEPFRAFDEGLRRHIRLEDEVVFPAFERATGNREGPTVAMRGEHQDILRLLANLREAMARREARAADPIAEALTSLLMRHNIKQERFVCPGTDSALDNSSRSELVARLRRAP